MGDLVGLVMAEAKTAAVENGGSIEERFKAAKLVAKNHWMIRDEDTCFRGAIGGVMLSYGEGTKEYELIKTEMTMLNLFATMIQAGRQGMSVTPPDIDPDFKAIGFMKLWKEE